MKGQSEKWKSKDFVEIKKKVENNLLTKHMKNGTIAVEEDRFINDSLPKQRKQTIQTNTCLKQTNKPHVLSEEDVTSKVKDPIAKSNELSLFKKDKTVLQNQTNLLRYTNMYIY